MARRPSKFAEISDSEQLEQVRTVWKNHGIHLTRIRAHALLLSAEGYEASELASIFSVKVDTVRSWIDRFNEKGIDGLEDEERPGGPPSLNDDEQQTLRELFNAFPRNPRKIIAELKRRTGKTISRTMLRRYARKFGLSWKRFRRSLKKQRDDQRFELAREELAELIAEPSLQVVYFDEAGFSLKGVVPYGWQPKGERLDVPVSGAHRSSVQVLGFESEDGSVASYVHKGHVNSETVIEIFDDYVSTLQEPTVVVLDNASCHTSKAFNARLDEWASKGLYVYHLSPYSPELNQIERFWKKVKYQLMPTDAWERFEDLLGSLTSVLTKSGETTWMASVQD